MTVEATRWRAGCRYCSWQGPQRQNVTRAYMDESAHVTACRELRCQEPGCQKPGDTFGYCETHVGPHLDAAGL